MLALPNPSFERKTHQWRPGAGAPSWEVPSQKCAFCAPKQPLHPLPFLPQKLANKQATTINKQQALLLSILAIAPPHRSGLYSALAISYPRWWWPCPIQVLSQNPAGGATGRGKSGGAFPKLRNLCPKTAFFWPKTAPKPTQNRQRSESVCRLQVLLNFLVNKSPLLPSNSTTCPRNGPKIAKNGLNVRCSCQTRLKPRSGRIFDYVAQI